jgi:DNA-binding CsgD family transcriptional regulator
MTPHESIQFAQLAQAAVRVDSDMAFRSLIEHHVQPLLPHGVLLAVIGQLTFEHLSVQHHIAIGYPDWALAHLTQALHIRERPILQRWLHTRAPVVVCTEGDPALLSERERFEAQAIGMGRLAVHGLPDLTNRMGSYFSFAQVDKGIALDELTQRLSMMVPLLHVALSQAIRPAEALPSNTYALTAIEQELLKWLAAGRSNQDMADMRQRSAATIRNQLSRLYEKLGVSTRAEAVALALRDTQHVAAPQGDRGAIGHRAIPPLTCCCKKSANRPLTDSEMIADIP